jgi:hypothetical protein
VVTAALFALRAYLDETCPAAFACLFGMQLAARRSQH